MQEEKRCEVADDYDYQRQSSQIHALNDEECEEYTNCSADCLCPASNRVISTLLDDGLQYAGLISHARNNIEKKIQELQTRLTYLDFMEDEVSFNDNKDPVGRSGDVYGSIALWTVPLKVQSPQICGLY